MEQVDSTAPGDNFALIRSASATRPPTLEYQHSDAMTEFAMGRRLSWLQNPPGAAHAPTESSMLRASADHAAKKQWREIYFSHFHHNGCV
jgi:hypothetical protein